LKPPPTYGSAAAKLRENGYTPVSALMPYGLTMATAPPFALPVLEHLISEHAPSVLCRSKRGDLVALVQTPQDDPALAGRIYATLGKHGITRGPYRLGSDGAKLWPLRCNPNVFTRNALDGTVTLHFAVRGPVEIYSTIIPLDGIWPQGDLLTVSYEKLPVISEAELETMFQELSDLPYKMAEEARPPPKPTRAAWLGR
jgi:hypothetical protein